MFLALLCDRVNKNSQRAVFIAFLLFFLSACFHNTENTTRADLNYLKSQDFITWTTLLDRPFSEKKAPDSHILAIAARGKPRGATVAVLKTGDLVINDGTVRRTITTIRPAPRRIAFGKRYALVAWNNQSKIFVQRIDQPSKRWILKRLKGRATSLAFHDDDSTLLIGGADGRVYRWRFAMEAQELSSSQKEKTLERYIGHHTIVSEVISIPKARAFLSTDWDGRLIAWLPYSADSHGGYYDTNLFGGRFFGGISTSMVAPRKQDRGITAAVLSDDSRKLAIGTADGFVEIWEIRGFIMSARHKVHNGQVVSIALNEDGSRIASLGKDNLLSVADLTRDSLYKVASAATLLKFSPLLSEPRAGIHAILFQDDTSLALMSEAGATELLSLPVKTEHASSTAPPTQNETSGFTQDSDY
jgi:WD40 repeat protein